MAAIRRLTCKLQPNAVTILSAAACRPSVMSKMATIECSTCSTLLEICPKDARGEPNLCWSALDADLCKAPPINRCPHARSEVKRRFAAFDG